jgi:hypothetical protein
MARAASLAAVWTRNSWLVGTNISVFHSALGHPPWTYTDFGHIRPCLLPSRFRQCRVHALRQRKGTGIEYTNDGGTVGTLDALPATFTYNIATIGDTLYGGRVDGLWRQPIVPPRLRPHRWWRKSALRDHGANPIHDEARLHWQPSQDGCASTSSTSPGATCRSVDQLAAGAHEVLWRSGHRAGICLARLSAGGRFEAVRFVRTR